MRNRVKALLVGALATGAVALPGATAQAAEIGQVCNVAVSYYVLSAPWEGSSILYIIGTGAGFRIEGYSGDYYLGHGNGQASGYFWRNNINQGSCHW